jgi:gas vesicle protein
MTMGFVMGLLTGLVAGAVGAVLYSVQTGRDLREEFDQMRSDVQRRDFDALGNRLEARFKELQGSLEERMAQARDSSKKAADDVAKDVASAADSAAEAADKTGADTASN